MDFPYKPWRSLPPSIAYAGAVVRRLLLQCLWLDFTSSSRLLSKKLSATRTELVYDAQVENFYFYLRTATLRRQRSEFATPLVIGPIY